MKNIFLIYTEHQLNGIMNAIDFFKITNKESLLFIFVPLEFSITKNEWINELKEKAIFDDVFIISEWSIVNSFFIRSNNVLNFTNQLINLSKYKVRLFSPIYNSDSVNLAYNILTPENLFILDDGNASFSVIIQRQRKKYISLYPILSSIYHRRNMLKFPKKIIYFTKYNLPFFGIDTIINYKEAIENNTLGLDESSIIILGSSIYETKRFHKTVVDFNDYLLILTNLHNKFSNKKIFYYAHRRESKNSILIIEKLGFTVVSNNAPFEKVFGDFKICPHIIFSFGSPILDNIGRRYKNVPRMITIKMNLSAFPNNGAEFELIYKDFEKKSYLEVISYKNINSFNV